MFDFIYNVCFFFKIKNMIIIPLKCFFGILFHVALDRNPGPGYNTLILWLILGDLYSACYHRQFHTLPNLLQSGRTAELLPYLLHAKKESSLFHFYDRL